MVAKTVIQALNIAGQSAQFVGGFLLTVEALKIARIRQAAETVKRISEFATAPTDRREALPFHWKYALFSLVLFGMAWYFPLMRLFAPPFGIYVLCYLIYRFLTLSVTLTETGYVAVVGFSVVTLGFLLQLIATILS